MLSRFFILLTLSLCSNIAIALDTVSVCWESELKPPYLMLEEDKKPYGIAVDILNEVFKRENIQVNNYLRPWKRCLAELKTGAVQVVPNSSYKENRKSFALFSKPMYKTHLSLFYSKEQHPITPVVTTVDDLKKYTVGGISGFNYDFYEGKVSVRTNAKTRKALIKKLKAKQLDFGVLQKEVIYMLANKGEVDLTGLGDIPDPVNPEKAFHILVSKAEPNKEEYLRVIDEGLEVLQNDGTTHKIMDKYLNIQQ